MRCPSCSAEVAAYARYCPKCGASVAGGQIQSCVVTVGRDQSNDLVIDDEHVSRHHAKVTLEGGSCVLEDTGSLNGVYVNGFKVQIERIKPGDQILLGQHVRLHYDQIVQAAASKGYGDISSLKTGFAVPAAVPRVETPPQHIFQAPTPPETPAPLWTPPPAEEIGVGQWIGYLLLAAIPILNLVLLIRWSRDASHPSRASWAAVYLWFAVAALLLSAVSAIIMHNSYSSIY